MHKFIAFGAILWLFAGCYAGQNFYDSKEEITLKTTMLSGGSLLSFLGSKFGRDFVVFSSEEELKSAKIGKFSARIEPSEQVDLPYFSEFIHHYFLSAPEQKQKTLEFCFTLYGSAQETCASFAKEFKSLDYHTSQELD